MQKAHPGLGIKNRFNVPDCPERVHWDEAFALEAGAPGAYDYGQARCPWLTHQLTHWRGCDGFLVKSKCQIRRQHTAGDVLFLDGPRKANSVENDTHYGNNTHKA